MERLTRYFSDWAHGAEGVSDKGLTGAYCRGKFEATAMVDRLAAIEDILGDTYDLGRLRELVEAEQEGRVRFVPKVSGAVCGTCKHFERFSGRKMGTCGVKKYASDRHRREDKSRAFVTSQANKACKRYELGKE